MAELAEGRAADWLGTRKQEGGRRRLRSRGVCGGTASGVADPGARPPPPAARPSGCLPRPSGPRRPPAPARRARPPDGPARPRPPLRPPGPGPQEEALTQQRGARELSAPGGFQPPDSSPAGACGSPEPRRPRRRPGELGAAVEEGGRGERAGGSERGRQTSEGERTGRPSARPTERAAPPPPPAREGTDERTDDAKQVRPPARSCRLSPGSSATVPPSGSAERLEVTAPGGRPLRRPGAGWVGAAGWQLGRAAAARASRVAEGGRAPVVSPPRQSRLASECAGGEAPAPPCPLPPSRSPRQGAAAGGGAAGSPAQGGGRPPAQGADRLLLDGGQGMGATPGRGVV